MSVPVDEAEGAEDEDDSDDVAEALSEPTKACEVAAGAGVVDASVTVSRVVAVGAMLLVPNATFSYEDSQANRHYSLAN